MINGSVRILLIEDTPGDARLIKELLIESGRPFELDSAPSLSAGFERLEGKDAILLDLSLPDSLGLDTFRRLHSRAAIAPIIVLTGYDDDDLSTRALQEGAQDYLVKGQVDAQILARSIRYSIERKRIDLALKSEICKHEKLEADLIIAKEEAEEAARAKAEFLANMSHELRTPMNAVIGFASLLLDGPLSPEQRELTEGIRDGGEALLAIIRDILDFSRMEREKIELELLPFELKGCIEESLEMVSLQAVRKGLRLECRIDPKTPEVIVEDRGRLRQILVNLLGNAVKFTDRGCVSVFVSSDLVKANSHQILFEVRDTGIGIPQEMMKRLFSPFEQLEASISHKREGIGLGLAISQKLVELMGGMIWAESTPGEGSVFYFTIQTESFLKEHERMRSADLEGTAGLSAIGATISQKVLVAEDNPSNQKVLMAMLNKLGYSPVGVANGREVLQALAVQQYDLILMDIIMPEMDGLAASQIIRNLFPEGGPKIIAITADCLEDDRERCLNAGIDDYLVKPIKLVQLEEAIERVLKINSF